MHFGNMFCKPAKRYLLSTVVFLLLFYFYLCIKDMLNVGEANFM